MKFKKTDLYNFVKKTINEVYNRKRNRFEDSIKLYLHGTETEASAIIKYHKGDRGSYNSPPESPTIDILRISVNGIGEIDVDKFISIENNVRQALEVPPLTEEELDDLVWEALKDYLDNDGP